MKMTAELFLFDLDIFYANFLESLKSSTMDLYDILDSHISKYNEFGKKNCYQRHIPRIRI